MTPLTTDMRIELAAKRGDMREALGWNFIKRLEKLVDELCAKLDCPQKFWIVYAAKWDPINRKVREFWGVKDEKPLIQQIGSVVYEIDKSGKYEYIALPFDIPVPDCELSDTIVKENIEIAKTLPLSDQTFEKI